MCCGIGGDVDVWRLEVHMSDLSVLPPRGLTSDTYISYTDLSTVLQLFAYYTPSRDPDLEHVWAREQSS